MRSFLSMVLCFCLQIALAQSPKVLIIGIDGCRSDALQAANTPNMDALMANGTFSYDALNNDVTSSGPGWSAMMTGVWSNKHGVTDNSFIGSNYGTYPHFIKYVEQHNSSLNTASIVHWDPINNSILFDADYELNVGTDTEIASEGAAYLTNNDPDVLFLHFDDCDGVGHGSGFTPNNPAYISTIETTDSHIQTVLNALYTRPNYANENWLILSSTDHGGKGTSHGGTSIQEERIFFIASGDEIPNQEIVKECNLEPIITNCLDTNIELDFDGTNDYVEISNPNAFQFGESQDFTIECRIKTSVAADVAIVGNKDWDSGFFNGFVFSFSGNEWKVNIGDGLFRADLNSGGFVSDNLWHTLSVTFDRDGDMTMYLDGNYVDATSIKCLGFINSVKPNCGFQIKTMFSAFLFYRIRFHDLLSLIGDINNSYPLRFGTDPLSSYDYTGKIAEVRVWNSILAANEIANWYCTSLDNTHPNYSDLLGYLPMNEGVGATIVQDQSPNSNNGFINEANWIEVGNCLNAAEELVFDGVDNYVDVANPSQLNFGASQDFTIECRVKTTEVGDVAIVGNKNWISGVNSGYVFSFAGNNWKVNVGDGSNRVDLETGGAIADGSWHTLSVTFDRDANMTMYEDGISVGTTSMASIGDINTGFSFRMGADAFNGYNYTGRIAEVRIWNKALGTTEINNWFCASLDNTHPDYDNLLGYWPMDEGTGNTEVQDLSSYNNIGTIAGASWQNPNLIEVCTYDNTPRIVDVAVTALAHLCIPINPAWNLDGVPKFSSCPVFIDACGESTFVLPHVYQSQYHAIQTVSSNAMIDGANIQFRAGTCIELDSDFEVKSGTDFEAIIVPCN